MEYEFIHDAITGEANARFSFEHQVIGPWIEVELGRDSDKMTQLLAAIEKIEKGESTEIIITGSEYSITLSRDDIEIQTNASFNNNDPLAEMLTDEQAQSCHHHVLSICFFP